MRPVNRKTKYIRSKRARDSARGEECTMNSPDCNYNPETTVLCHSNMERHGKGRGIKASDQWTFYGCSACNYYYDSGKADRDMKERLFWKAWERTQQRFKDKGLMEVVCDCD